MERRGPLRYWHIGWTSRETQPGDLGTAAVARYRCAAATSWLLPACRLHHGDAAGALACVEAPLQTKQRRSGRTFLSFAVVDVNPSMTSSIISSMVMSLLDERQRDTVKVEAGHAGRMCPGTGRSRSYIAPRLQLPCQNEFFLWLMFLPLEAHKILDGKISCNWLSELH